MTIKETLNKSILDLSERGRQEAWFLPALRAQRLTPLFAAARPCAAGSSERSSELVQSFLKPSRNDDDLKKVFRRVEKIFQSEEGTVQADERDVLVTLVEVYECKYYDFGPAYPVEAIKFRMEQEGLTPRDLEPFIGPSGRMSEVLNRKRPLRTLVEIILSTPRVYVSGRGKARVAGTGGTIAKTRNAAAAAHGHPNAKIISTRVLSLRMVKRLHEGLKIPYESLLAEVS